ncbi:hypothetical protein OPQ81_009170 [Rhizoctonia solani]|nr:hypothetical protein OPQ81_009170 [Rhizoctonia solani]
MEAQTPIIPNVEMLPWGPFPLPTSSPVTPLTEWTTRPLTQVNLSTAPIPPVTQNDSGIGEEQGEVEMSMSSTGSEGATEQGLMDLCNDLQTQLDELGSVTVVDVERELSNARDLLTQLAKSLAVRVERERMVVSAIQHAAEVLQCVTGHCIKLDLATANLPSASSAATMPSMVNTGILQSPAAAGLST